MHKGIMLNWQRIAQVINGEKCISEISKELGITYSSAHKIICCDLVELGIVNIEQKQRFSVPVLTATGKKVSEACKIIYHLEIK